MESFFSVRWADSATQAQAACTGRFWDWVSLEAQNALSLFLSRAVPERFRHWNEIVQDAKVEVIGPLMAGILARRLEVCGIGVGTRHRIEYDLTMALVASAHSDLDERPRFFEQLLQIYRAGHVPCGWYAGRPPQGVLLVW